MPYQSNNFIYSLFVVLISYMSYEFLWTRFGLGVTSAVQYVLLVFVLLACFLYLIKSSILKNSWTNWLILIWISQVLAFYIGGSSATTQFKESTFVLLTATPIVSMRYNPKPIKYLFVIMALVSIAMYFVTNSMMKLEDENSYGGGYMILVALPVLLYFFREKTLHTQVTITIMLFLLVLSSMKRGDIIACILAILVYYYIKIKTTGKIDFRIILAILFTALIGFFAFNYFLATNELFAWRFEQTVEGNSSGRDDIYSSLWNYFLEAPIDVKLLGGGFDATLKIAGTRAHSDILEVLSCEGIVGLAIYVGAFVSLFKQMIKRRDVTEKAILASVLVIWSVKMSLSMFIFSQPTIVLFALTAYILNNRINKHYEY